MKPPAASVPELLTARLRLRAFRAEDAADFHNAYGDPEAMRHWNQPFTANVAATAKVIARWARPTPWSWMVWAVADRDSDRCLGMVNYHSGSRGNRRVEVGYILVPSAWGKGYATEATSTLIAHLHAQLPARRIEAVIAPENIRSVRLAERLGFVCEAPLLRDYLRVDGVWWNMALYAHIAAD